MVGTVKNLTVTKRLFLEWARSRYGQGVRFVRRGAVDFVLPDGSRVIVKRPIRGFLYFTSRQWRELSDTDLVAVVSEVDGVLGVVPVREARSGAVAVGGRQFAVIVERVGTARLVVRCSEETYERFRRLASYFRDYEETLRYLLDLHDLYGYRRPKPGVY